MLFLTPLFRFTLVLAIALGLTGGAWTAGSDGSRMTGLHEAAMRTMHHDMAAMAGSVVEDKAMGVGFVTLCKQHCSAVAAVLPAAVTPPAFDLHGSSRERPAPVALSSTSPLLDGPPPKASFA